MSDPAPKRRWFRFSLRTLFFSVILVATSLGFWRRADRLEKLAGWHEEEAAQLAAQASIGWLRGLPIDPIIEQRDQHRQREEKAQARYHESMAAKCRRSIWRPWVRLEPDYPTR